jgi:hypothetical protein
MTDQQANSVPDSALGRVADEPLRELRGTSVVFRYAAGDRRKKPMSAVLLRCRDAGGFGTLTSPDAATV